MTSVTRESSSSHSSPALKPKHQDLFMDSLRRRDRKFLCELFESINPYLMKFTLGHGLSQDACEELIQSTWEQFFSSFEKFEGRSHIKTFICGILINKIHEHRRLTNKMVYEEDSEAIFKRSFSLDGWWQKPPEDPHRLAECRQLATFLEHCLEGLSRQQRAAFLLKELHGEPSSEISSTLNISCTNLRVILFRAKDKLRKCLEGRMSVGLNQ